MKIASLVPILLCTFLLTGCPDKPNKPSALSALITVEMSKFQADETDYDNAIKSGDLDKARRMRNRIVERLRNLIDNNYLDFEGTLAKRRNNENILFDTTELGAAVATTITNGERAKTIIAAALTAFKGGRKSIDQNVFRERTTEAIIAKMREARAEVGSQLSERLDASTQTYSLEHAYGDLINYFYAGTLQNGLQRLTQDAGQDATVAEKEAAADENMRIATIATQEDFDNSKLIRQRLRDLSKDLRSNDEQKQANARSVIKSALTTLGETPADNATDKELLDALVNKFGELSRSSKDSNRFDPLLKALKMQ
jgi:hypothetical protein